MTTYVAFLRGVNLGSQRSVSMPRLLEIAGDLGYEDAWTYLRTGNVAFTTGKAERTVERELANALTDEYGTSVDVTVRTEAELRATLEANPFPDESPSRVTVAFLTGPAPKGVADRIARVATDDEPFVVGDREIWVLFGAGQARSNLGAGFSRVVGVSATTRTVGTVGKLVAKLEAQAGQAG